MIHAHAAVGKSIRNAMGDESVKVKAPSAKQQLKIQNDAASIDFYRHYTQLIKND